MAATRHRQLQILAFLGPQTPGKYRPTVGSPPTTLAPQPLFCIPSLCSVDFLVLFLIYILTERGEECFDWSQSGASASREWRTLLWPVDVRPTSGGGFVVHMRTGYSCRSWARDVDACGGCTVEAHADACVYVSVVLLLFCSVVLCSFISNW
ncbi:hypothetical protein I3843_04G047400 [Carya illinoinensis]|nr:hypothetical protein I3843_04G047400 [Carya illinoinensis]